MTSKTNEAVFSTQPMAEVFNPRPARLAAHVAPMQVVAPQATPRQLNASFVAGAESNHDHASRRLIEGMLLGAGAGLAWSSWRHHLRNR